MTGRVLLLSGLPGSGKTTLARALCTGPRAVHLRVDTIEQAICESELAPATAIDAGYRVAAAQAVELTEQGQDVVCDAVNADPRARAIWPEADLVIWVRIPEELRAKRIASRGFPEYPHVWEDWSCDVIEADGAGDPSAQAHTIWKRLSSDAFKTRDKSEKS